MDILMSNFSRILVALVFFMPAMSFAQTSPVAEVGRAQELMDSHRKFSDQLTSDDGRVLIRHIVVSGFVLKDKQRLESLLRSYQNKRLSQQQIQDIINTLKSFYLEAGYADLVDIDYTVEKDKLSINIFLTSR